MGVRRDRARKRFGHRNKDTLFPIIKDWIRPGTTIMSDCWKAYDCLGDERYYHLKVIHSANFVDPETGACTNRIEASWKSAQRERLLHPAAESPFMPGIWLCFRNDAS